MGQPERCKLVVVSNRPLDGVPSAGRLDVANSFAPTDAGDAPAVEFARREGLEVRMLEARERLQRRTAAI